MLIFILFHKTQYDQAKKECNSFLGFSVVILVVLTSFSSEVKMTMKGINKARVSCFNYLRDNATHFERDSRTVHLAILVYPVNFGV